MSPAQPPSMFHDLPADAFPLTVEFLRADTRQVVDVIHVAEPGAVTVKPYSRIHGTRIAVRLTYGDGRVEEPT